METPKTVRGREPHPTLSQSEQDAIGAELQDMLAELVDLALVGKQLHWTVVGPAFLPLHRLLDELVAAWRELADTIAERARAIGAWPDGQARTVADTCEAFGFEATPAEPIDDEEALREMIARLTESATRTRARAASVGELDPVSQDVLIDVVRALERQLWMLRAQGAR